MSQGLATVAEKQTETPSSWISKHFYVPDPRDVETGEVLSPGPIRLTEHQKRIIDAALEIDPETGLFKYTTIIYSAPKKSGKSAITSAVILYMAYHNPNSFLACLANDGKQSADRLYGPIVTCLRLHRQLGGILSDVSPTKTELTLENFTKIEAVPCDAAGEAGSQPLVVAFSELWAYDSDKKRRLFVEMTPPPTLHGRAIRWIETYAGYTGESELLEQMYETGFIKGVPHPDFDDLQGKDGPVVRVNGNARMFTYWDTEARMKWQIPEYYFEQAAILPSQEFDRIHRNMWVSPVSAFVDITWWDACENKDLPPLTDKDTPVVVGIDMAVTRDCAALVAVTRDPFAPETKVAVRAVKIFNPKLLDGAINQEKVVRPVIEEWAERWNVICWAYDPKEMAKLAQDLTRAGVGWFKPFGQVQPRAISDKKLHDMIMHRQIIWNTNTTEGDVGWKGNDAETLYKHITQAGASTRGEAYRIEKLSNSAKVDGCVALSQAAHTAMMLNLDNFELTPSKLQERLSRGDLTPEELAQRMRYLNGNRP